MLRTGTFGATGVLEVNEMPKCLGTLKGLGGVWDNMHEQSGRVYDTQDVAPTVHTNGGGGQEIKVLTNDKPICLNSKGGRNGIDGLQPSVKDRVYDSEGVAPCVTTSDFFMSSFTEISNERMRVRKLTPKECWRLMGFTDSDFDKARAALIEKHYNGQDRANSQLYKQAGNSIVVNVIEGILKNLIPVEPEDKAQGILDWLDNL